MGGDVSNVGIVGGLKIKRTVVTGGKGASGGLNKRTLSEKVNNRDWGGSSGKRGWGKLRV